MTPVVIPPAPTAREFAAARLLLAPWRALTAACFRGFEHVPRDRPALYVGNHTLLGVLDVPLMVLALHRRCGVVVRPLGDHIHFQVPLWRDLLARFGTVEGTPEHCRALMRSGESVLVFPGGAREVFKHRGEQYRLLWKDRRGFARLAIEAGYPIVPFAAVGADDCFDVVFDADDLRRTTVGRLIGRLTDRADEIPPIVLGWGGSPLPRPERFYFAFGAPIETASFGKWPDREAATAAVRDAAMAAVEAGIRQLRAVRDRDPARTLAARVLGRRVPPGLRQALGWLDGRPGS